MLQFHVRHGRNIDDYVALDGGACYYHLYHFPHYRAVWCYPANVLFGYEIACVIRAYIKTVDFVRQTYFARGDNNTTGDKK
jgi:hypothetical protein